MSDSFYAVVMAGGGGTRLWPVSRRNRPKQALKLIGDQSLFQATISRLLPLIPPVRVLVVTVEGQAELLRTQVRDIPAENFLIEPSPRGTAAVIGLAAVALVHKDPEAVMACLPADHFIREDERLQAALREAEGLARRGYLVSLGLKPTSPETGYGYLQKGPSLGVSDTFEAFEVESFKEKPDAELAVSYLRSGDYLWNAGIFVWRCSRILEEIDRWMPDLGKSLAEIAAADGDRQAVVERVWPKLQPQTIDYGVMEKADQVAMLELEDLGWWDVGSWDRLLELLPKDRNGNVVLAKAASMLETTNSLIYQSDTPAGARFVALVGVDDLIVVDVGDAVLVTSRDKAQMVRELVKRLEVDQEDRYL
jgi:mannose-1-phosphate guanylyltransferase